MDMDINSSQAPPCDYVVVFRHLCRGSSETFSLLTNSEHFYRLEVGDAGVVYSKAQKMEGFLKDINIPE